MNRLPAKTKGPIRVGAGDHVIANPQARPMPEASGATSRVAHSLDRVLTLKLLRFPTVRERTGLSRPTICASSAVGPSRSTGESQRTSWRGSKKR